MKHIIIYLAITFCLHATLPSEVQQQINKSGIAKNEVSVYIKEVGGDVIASYNAHKAMTPASVIKVVTTYASILNLGFDYRWPTQFYTTGILKNGVLHGDLIVKGFGDPTLSSDDLPEIINEISKRGIRKIGGSILIDRSYFKVGNKDNSGFDENIYSPYNAMPDAMMFNERISTICVAPNKNRVIQKSVDYSYKIVNHLQRINVPCEGRYSWPIVKIDKTETVPSVLLHGKISQRCGERKISQVITKPYKSFYYALKDALLKKGIKVQGGLKLEKVPSSAHILFTHYSQSLEEIVSTTAKDSNNLYARHLLLLLGAKMYGAPATLSKGRSAIVNILKSKKTLHNEVLQIDNGSGLSRISKLNAKLLSDVLEGAYEKYGERWRDTLSVAGIDGTIKRRFGGTIVSKHAWMKTGTLKRVKNIAGYVKNRAGKLYNVVILVNSNKGNWRANQLQNEIIQWLANGTSKPKEIRQHISEKYAQKNIQPAASVNIPKGYAVQVGSFAQAPNAAYLARIKKAGFSYRVLHQSIYRVIVGPYGDESSAKRILADIRKKLNRGAFIVKL